jgi:hypothetical protein
MNVAGLVVLAAMSAFEGPHPMDAAIPPQPTHDYDHTSDGVMLFKPHARGAREVGTGTTVFVNFDGVELGDCSPSDSKRNCHWYNNDEPFEPFSGSMQIKASVLQAMRRKVSEFGIRVTGVRPPASEDYTMVVYGGTEAEYGALGSAPAGDCLDQRPNEIVFAHLDGDLAGWINGGATTALHEAAHSWGLDHIDARGGIMFPSGDDTPTAFRMECDQIVANTDLNPTEGSCPGVNSMLCPQTNQQNAAALLSYLFGPPYVDITPPTVTLVEPRDGQYFQHPASFDVVLDIDDDLHPQFYSLWAWLGDDERPDQSSNFVVPQFAVSGLDIGTWDVHVVVADEAGNETQIDFSVEIGEDPPPDPAQGCSMGPSSRGVSGIAANGWLCLLVLAPAMARRRPTG